MKWSPHPPRTPSDLPESSHQRLNMYSLTAGAAGVGMLALAQPSEAKVIYTPAHVKFGRNTEFLLDLNHDGITDFHLINNFSNFGNRISYRLFVSAYNQPNSIQGVEDAAALKVGAQIGPKQHFSHRATLMAHFYTSSGQVLTSSGPWKNVKNRYLGLKFSVNGKIHYGWARLSVSVHEQVYGISGVLTGYAYETIPNKPIITSKTQGTEEGSDGEANPATLDKSTLQSANLGLLAAGAPGLSIWRREEFASDTLGSD